VRGIAKERHAGDPRPGVPDGEGVDRAGNDRVVAVPDEIRQVGAPVVELVEQRVN